MGCNALNHPPDCRCGWGGDGHKGKSSGGRRGHYVHLPQSQRNITSEVDTANRLTRCPKCQSEVFFIKYNGGSIWFDPPLGPPWYKHACFDTGYSNNSRSRLKTSFDGLQKGFSSTVKIVVVASCVYNNHSGTTSLKAQFDDGGTYSFSVRGDARIFVGRLCFFDPPTKAVWPVEDHEKRLYFQGGLSKHLSSEPSGNGEFFSYQNTKNERAQERVGLKKGKKCKICGELSKNQKSYRRHLIKAHGVILVSDENGYLVEDIDKFLPSSLIDSESHENSTFSEAMNKNSPAIELNSNDELKFILKSAFDACFDKSGWAELASVGSWLSKERPKFSSKGYGFSKLSLLLDDLDYIEVKKESMQGHSRSSHVYIRFF